MDDKIKKFNKELYKGSVITMITDFAMIFISYFIGEIFCHIVWYGGFINYNQTLYDWISTGIMVTITLGDFAINLNKLSKHLDKLENELGLKRA